MTPPWGINWQRYHADRNDMPHIAKMGYRSFTIYEWMWSNHDFVNELLSVARKDAIFLNRDHPLSEQKDDQWINDPALKGRNHANEWAQKVKEGKVFTPLDRTYFLGINEPDSHQHQRQIDTYNEAFCRRMAQHGLRAAAYSFGVGQPSTIDLQPKTPPDWSWYAASAAAVLEGYHLAAFHEYGAPTVGGYGWEYWCNRVAACPYPFDAGFDECGIDNGVVNSGQLYGYAKFMPGADYLLWLDGFQVGMAERAHTRKVNLLFYNIFSFDHGSSEKKDWHSFDIRPLRPLLEAFQWTEVAQPPSLPPIPQPHEPVTTHLPSIGSGTPTPAWVAVIAGANIRSEPVTGKVLIAVPYGEKVAIVGYDEESRWFMVRYRSTIGWMMATLLSYEPVEVKPTPQPEQPVSGDKWQRTINFILKEEGGFTANDEGAPANFGINQGANPDLDVKNITREQAIERYRTKYWMGSGADQLEWPFCLLVMDASVQHGQGVAAQMLKQSMGNPWRFQGLRQDFYASIEEGKWRRNGRAWMKRMSRLLLEASQ